MSTSEGIPGWRRPLPGLHPVALIVVYAAVAVLPLAVAALQGLPPARIVWRELGSGLAMVGFAAMLVQFVLSGRFERVSGRTGIDLTMRFHQLAAWTIAAFIVLHPLLYAVPALHPDPRNALAVLNRMFLSEGLRTGVIAWWLLLAFIVVAVFRDRLRLPYELWRLSHGLGAAAIAGLSLHHTLRVGRHSGELPLTVLWSALTAVAVLSLVHVYLVKPLLQRRQPFRVVANRPVALRMWEVTVEPAPGTAALRFAPGQFAWLNLGHSPFSLTEHPFSMSSCPADLPRIAFTIKESGDFTDGIGRIPVGTRAYLDGPHGNFTLGDRDARGLVFIAGGVGLAPIVSILRQLRAERDRRPIRLVYGNRVREQILYEAELAELERDLDFVVHHVLSEPPPGWPGRTGQLDVEVLKACLSRAIAPDWLYFVCGPPAMMDSVERSLERLGVPADRIVSERFKYN